MQIVLYTGIGILAVIAVLMIAVLPFMMFDYAIVRKPPLALDDPEQTKGTDWEKYSETILRGKRWILSQNPERCEITSRDGLKLVGHFLDSGEKRRGAVLLVHGFNSLAYNDFSCIVQKYFEAGYSVLMIDQRAHGESEGKYTCFGMKECGDVLLWLNLLNQRLGSETDLFMEGISMGATSVLLASGMGDIPENVRGVIADCGFTSPRDEFIHVLHTRFRLPAFPLINMTERICKRKAGFGFSDMNTVEAMKKNRLPVLFVHGLADTFVPPEMTIQAYDACIAPKKLVLVENAAHGGSYLTEPERCYRELLQFLETNQCVKV